MLTAVVTFSGSTFEVALQGTEFVTAEEGTEAEGPENDLNPIAPELKEVVWGFGAFVVLALAMRLFLFRKVRDGMTSRYGMIEGDLEQAGALTASARADVAEYDAQVATVRAEAQTRVDSARATLEADARRAARRRERPHRRKACCGRRRGRCRQAGCTRTGRIGGRRCVGPTRRTRHRTSSVRRRRASCRYRGDGAGGVGMNLFTAATLAAGRLLPSAGGIPFDDKGYTTIDPIVPPWKELIPGSLASIIVFTLLYKYAGPIVKKSFADRTAGIQKQIDDSAAAKVAAESEAVRIREAQGDIDAERARLYAEADAQAEALLADGRVRLDAEMAELEARADTDITAAAGRSSDELRAEIARHAGDAVDRIVLGTLDDAAQQDLIEGFIARVGAGVAS